MDARPRDQLGRPLGVLRLSLTARCNLACPYCLPDGQEPPGLLSLDQRLALVEACVDLGVSCLRLTGGEPLLHAGLEELVAAVQPLRRRGLAEVALTSNGTLLSADRARALKAAGLDRLTLSLDGADGASVARMAGLADAAAGERALSRVLEALEHARAAGFDPACGALKLNAVIQRGVELRLIEFMDVGSRNGWRPERVLSAAEMLERIGAAWPLEALGRAAHGTAGRWRYRDGGGLLAVVASVSQPFCGDCNRLRITADGIAYRCLFADPSQGVDLRPFLGPQRSAHHLRQAIAGLWQERRDRWSEQRQQAWAGVAASDAVLAGPSSSADGATPESPPAAAASRHAEMAYLGG